MNENLSYNPYFNEERVVQKPNAPCLEDILENKENQEVKSNYQGDIDRQVI
jgi:hypothetical protein